MNKSNRGFRTSHSSSLKKLLGKTFKTGNNIWAPGHRVAQAVWPGSVLFMLDLDSGKKYRLESPSFLGR